MLLSQNYKNLLVRMHQKHRSFGAGSKRKKDRVLAVKETLGCESILDYGCGKASLKIDGILRYDPGIEQFSSPPSSADLIVCTDVLEHIEPECLDDVLEHIDSLMLKAGYFTIGIKPAKKKLPDGRNAHLIVESPQWWMKKMNHYQILEWAILKDGKPIEERELELVVKK